MPRTLCRRSILVSAMNTGGKARLTLPGLESSRMTEGDEAQAIWSMAFEASDPAVLGRAHHKMVKEYYGLTK